MTKITLNNVTSLQNEGSALMTINNNSAAITAAVENILSRDGTVPNQMTNSLDMNSNRIINLPNATTAQEPVTNSQAVRYDSPQTLTAIQKSQARSNIGAGTGSGSGGAVDSVFGRTATVIATAGDYTGSLVTNVPAGNVVATNVQTAVNELDTKKAPLASPAFTGTPTVPTALIGTNTTQAASTAFVIANAGGSPPVTSVFTRTGAIAATTGDYTATQVTNTPAGGISANNVQTALNGLDTAKANIASPTFTGVPLAPTAAVDTNTTQLATTAFTVGQASGANPLMNGAVAQGTSLRYSRQDHVHPTDTTRAPIASPTFTGIPIAPTASPLTNNTQIATTAYTDAAVTAGGAGVSAANGQCFLSYVSATQIKLSPRGGDGVRIAGTSYTIPSAGITAANTSVFVNGVAASNLAVNTTYLVCLFNNAGTRTIDFITTLTHVPDTAAGNVGVEIKNADNTRTVVGMVRTNASAQFVNSPSQRFVRTWFNKDVLDLTGADIVSFATASATYIEISTSKRVEWVQWATDVANITLIGVCNSSVAGGLASATIGIDGTTASAPETGTQSGGAGYRGSVATTYTSTLSDGYHFAVPLGGAAGGGTATFGSNAFAGPSMRFVGTIAG